MRKNQPNRRQVLKTASLGFGLALGPGIVHGKNSETPTDKIYEAALERMQQQDSVAAFRDHLAKHDIAYTTADAKFKVEKSDGDNDESSIQKLDKADLQIWMTLSRPNCDYVDRYRGEISFDWSWQDWNDWGDFPDDAMGITFSDRHFYIPDQNGGEYWTSDKVDYDSQNHEGIGFSIYDVGADDGQVYSAGAKLWKNTATSDSNSQRKIYGEYEHTWNGEWSGLSISVGMISLNWTSSGDAWDTNEDHNGVPLVSNAGDLDFDDCDSTW